jgi:hypothetical protein
VAAAQRRRGASRPMSSEPSSEPEIAVLPLALGVGAVLAGLTSLQAPWVAGLTLVELATASATVEQLGSWVVRALPVVLLALSVLFAAVGVKNSFTRGAGGSTVLWFVLCMTCIGGTFLAFFHLVTPGGLFGGSAPVPASAGALEEASEAVNATRRGLLDAPVTLLARALKHKPDGEPTPAPDGLPAEVYGSNIVNQGEITAIFSFAFALFAAGCGLRRGKAAVASIAPAT